MSDSIWEYFKPTDVVWYLDRIDIDDAQALIIASELRSYQPSEIFLNDNRSSLLPFRMALSLPKIQPNADVQVNIDFCRIGDVGAKAIACAIAGNETLCKLDLRRSDFFFRRTLSIALHDYILISQQKSHWSPWLRGPLLRSALMPVLDDRAERQPTFPGGARGHLRPISRLSAAIAAIAIPDGGGRRRSDAGAGGECRRRAAGYRRGAQPRMRRRRATPDT
jgi:hypothetical protein